MQRFLDKWGLPILAVIIGAIILWGLFLAPGRPKDEPKGLGGGGAAAPNKLQ